MLPYCCFHYAIVFFFFFFFTLTAIFSRRRYADAITYYADALSQLRFQRRSAASQFAMRAARCAGARASLFFFFAMLLMLLIFFFRSIISFSRHFNSHTWLIIRHFAIRRYI